MLKNSESSCTYCLVIAEKDTFLWLQDLQELTEYYRATWDYVKDYGKSYTLEITPELA